MGRRRTLYRGRWQRVILAVLPFLTGLTLAAQSSFSSNLPIVLIDIDTDPATLLPAEITKEARVMGTMRIVYSPTRTEYTLDDFNDPALVNYNGRISIKLRGYSSLLTEKQGYAINTLKADGESNNNVPLMGMPKENDWVLSGLYYDYSFMRDCLTYTLGRLTGRYAPRTRHCELFLNGDYRGLYSLNEKIKIDKNRVNIAKLAATDTLYPQVEGGYIVKADRPDSDNPAVWSTTSYANNEAITNYILHAPKYAKAAPAQAEYIRQYFYAVMQAIEQADTDATTGYPALIDEGSFVDFMLLNELASNVDAYQFSTFFHKDRGGKLHAGPLWDFNFAYGNDFRDRARYDVWQFDDGNNTGSPFWLQLYNSPRFHRLLARRWQTLTADRGPLAPHAVLRLTDSLQQLLRPAVQRDGERWDYSIDYDYHCTELRAWLLQRYHWLDQQLCPQRTADTPRLVPTHTPGQLEIVGNPASVTSITLYSLTGAPVSTYVSRLTINIGHIPAGVYIAVLTTTDGRITQKIII